jgi:hypothetical protein
MLSQVAVDVSSRFRFICNRNLLSVHAPHLSAFQALDRQIANPSGRILHSDSYSSKLIEV